MQKPLSEKFVKQSIIKWLFRNGWGRNLGALLYIFSVSRDGKVRQYTWQDLKKSQKARR